MFNLALITSAVRLSTPLTLAAYGGLFSERSGIVNIALEGLMLFGAFTAAAATYYTGSPWIGFVSACAVGAAVAAVHGVVSILFNGSQIVSGMAINILAIGLPQILCAALFGTPSSSPFLAEQPIVGEIFSHVTVLVWAGFAVAAVTAIIFRYTRFGLRLTAAGENPAALDAAGVSVVKYRFAGVIISGVLAGLGGAYLSIAHVSQFIRNMSAGRGFIALAALILGNWKPCFVLPACLFFGFMDALQIRLQGSEVIPVEIIQILPYLITVIVLIGIISKPSPPAGLGIPYHISKQE